MVEDLEAPPAEEQLVIFRLGEDFFAMGIGSVNEIIRLQPITPVPKAPAFVEGVTSLRGRVIPVVDLRKRFGIPAHEDARNRIIVADHGGKLIGMMVDAVDEVLTVPADAIEPPDDLVVSIDSQFLAGIVRLEDRLIVLVDEAQVLSATEVKLLQTLKVPAKALKAAETSAEPEAALAIP